MIKRKHVFITAAFTAFLIAVVLFWQMSAVAQCVPDDLNCMNLP